MPQRVQSLRTSTKNTRPAGGTREAGELYVSFPDLQLGVINAAKNAQDLIAVRFFSASTDYATGDFVIQAGVGYRAKTSITAGAFNASQWDTIATNVSAEPPIAAGTTSQYWRGDKSWQTLDKTAVGLANVDNTSDATKPISSATQAALNLKAPLASPTFTGTVIAPTQPAGTNNTTVATTAFVAVNYAPILDPFFAGDPRATTPPTSDNDTSLATTAFVKANLVSYAPLASPVFTGNPVSPTPSPGDNDTSIATTAFVQDAIGNRPTDAPNDANAYGRKALAWVDVTEEAPADGVSYGRKNGAWVASVGGAVISDTPPGAPLTPGQLWYEADSGNTFLWYSDADSSQWVQVNVQPASAPSPVSGLTAETRNRLVNGAMQISQEQPRDAGISLTSGVAVYPVDQWVAVQTSSASMGCRSASDIVHPDVIWRIRMNVGSPGDASLAAGEGARFYQPIEGIRIADFAWGTAAAKQVILRFTVKSSVLGTFCAAIRNGATNRSFVKNFIVTQTTDQEFTIVIPGDTTGTWPVDNTVAMYLSINVAAGSSLIGVEGWQAGNFQATSACTNLLATINSSFDLTKVGLYLDPQNTGVPPRWTMPDEAQELASCMRYYEKSYNYADLPGAVSAVGPLVLAVRANNTTATDWATPIFTVPKRVSAGTVTIYPPDGSPAGSLMINGVESAAGLANISEKTFWIRAPSTTALTVGQVYSLNFHYVANARM